MAVKSTAPMFMVTHHCKYERYAVKPFLRSFSPQNILHPESSPLALICSGLFVWQLSIVTFAKKSKLKDPVNLVIRSHFCHENRNGIFPQNVGNHLADFVVSAPAQISNSRIPSIKVISGSTPVDSMTKGSASVLLGIRTSFKADLQASVAEFVYRESLRIPGKLLMPIAHPVEPAHLITQLHQ
jgi:hypothetical protein